MKTYMAYAGDAPEDGALLVFAHTAKEARQVSWVSVANLMGCDYIDVRVVWLKVNAPHLVAAANSAKMVLGEAHVIEYPPSCSSCCLWGDDRPIEENGRCADCNEDLEG